MAAPICLWSGPRNVSTALMYSFAQRSDTRVVDEPLYAHYLRVSGAPHPGRQEVLRAQDDDGNRVVSALLQQQSTTPDRLFIKHMAHHLVDMDQTFLQQTSNVLLIRDPREMLPSLTIQLPEAGAADTGLRQQLDLFASLANAGKPPAILDSRQLLLNPSAVLRQLCAYLNIDFESEMLTWPAGPRREDGIWAKHWYHAVHKSTGFAPYSAKTDFPPNLQRLLQECQPWYEELFGHAIRANTKR